MMKKGLSVLFSSVLVLMLTVSFSMPVKAARSSYEFDFGTFSGTSRTSKSIDANSSVSKSYSTFTFSSDSISFTAPSSGFFFLPEEDFPFSLTDVSIECEEENTLFTYESAYASSSYYMLEKYSLSGNSSVTYSYFKHDNDGLYLEEGQVIEIYVEATARFDNIEFVNNSDTSVSLAKFYITCTFASDPISFCFIPETDPEAYDYGYEAGYSDGYDTGLSDGYTNGYSDGESSVDTDSIYNEGYQAGADSVDTDSYYNAGYQSGYDEGYTAAYEAGYKAAVNSSFTELDSVSYTVPDSESICVALAYASNKNTTVIPFSLSIPLDFSTFDPVGFQNVAGADAFLFDIEFTISKTVTNVLYDILDINDVIFSFNGQQFHALRTDLANSTLSDTFSVNCLATLPFSLGSENFLDSPVTIVLNGVFSHEASSTSESSGICHVSLSYSKFDVTYYDSGSINSAFVKEQVQEITTGYDNSGMESSNSSLAGSMDDYGKAESQIMDQSLGFIDDAEFYDPSDNASLITCLSFCTSWMQSLFVNLGDWGILVMVSLSLSLGLMLIGWFKYR